MNSFEFKSDDVFYIWGNGFIFHGQLVLGKIKENDEVVIKTKKGDLYAKVNLIASLTDRGVIEEAEVGEKIAISLNRFSKKELNNIHKRFNPDIDAEPSTTDFLNVEYPITIKNRDKKNFKNLIKNWLN